MSYILCTELSCISPSLICQDNGIPRGTACRSMPRARRRHLTRCRSRQSAGSVCIPSDTGLTCNSLVTRFRRRVGLCVQNAERLCPIQICFKKPTKASTIFGQIILSSGKGQNLKMRFWLERSLFLNNRFFGPSNGFYFTNALKNYALSRRQIRLKGLESRIRKMQK